MRGVKKFKDEEDLTDGGLDAGLTVLAAVMPRDVVLSLDEIAFVCGCSRQDIWGIERRAKQKLKAEFERLGLDTFI